MGKINKEVVMVPLSQITPDENQPRKYFDPMRIAELKGSIKTHGIMTPLTIEKRKDGTYLLVDGERRYRASTEMGLKEVPAIILDEQSPTERLIKQFHLQEQHEGWTAVEKAVAMKNLSDALGISMVELGRTLGIPQRTVNNYVAYGNLLERNEYQKNEFPLDYARNIDQLKNTARRVLGNEGEDFHQEDERAFEKAIIARMKIGEIKERKDFSRINDSILRDSKTVRRIIKTKVSGAQLYKETDAEAMTHVRRLSWAVNYTKYHIDGIHRLNAKELMSPAQRASIRNAAERLTEFARELA